jgi:hypothetical protein
MKKAIKKIISKIVPKLNLKEKIKLFYYSLFKPKNVVFELVDNSCAVAYKTTFCGLSFFTNEALYPIFDDFNYYQHFCKVKLDDVVVDAVANCGHLSILFSKLVGPNGKVIAFEPENLILKGLKKTAH